MNKSFIQSGRPRLLVYFGLILDLRKSKNLDLSMVAQEYTKRTAQYINEKPYKRGYEDVKFRQPVTANPGQILKHSRSPPDPKESYPNNST